MRGSSWTFPGIVPLFLRLDGRKATVGGKHDNNPQEDGRGSDFIQGDCMKHDLKEKERGNKEHNLGIQWNNPVWLFTNFLFLKTLGAEILDQPTLPSPCFIWFVFFSLTFL